MAITIKAMTEAQQAATSTRGTLFGADEHILVQLYHFNMVKESRCEGKKQRIISELKELVWK